MAEHYVKTERDDDDDDTEEKFIMFLSAKDLAEARGTGPALTYFNPTPDFYAIFESDDDLVESQGIEDDRVSLDGAKRILESEDYKTLKKIMLSVSVD